MGWPWKFVELTTAQQHERRQLLDLYGLCAQLSGVLILIILLLARLTQWGLRRIAVSSFSYDAIPTSPEDQKGANWTRSLSTKRRQVLWWLESDLTLFGLSLGRRDQLLYGVIWGAWLTFLSIHRTGNDYLHLTKRFGAIGASQFPLQYLLSLKRFNPVAFVFRTSHEHINRWHRVLGYITYLFIVLHGIFYLNYYIQIGDMPDALLRAVPVLGLIGLFFMTMLSTTALSLVRQYSYRVFYLAHLFVALAMPPLIWLHVHHSRVFMTESFLILIFGMVVRRYGIVKTGAAIEVHHGTDLIKVVATIPSKKLQQFAAHPASHVYLSIPAETRPDPNPLSWSYLRFIFTSNPFTVAEFNEEASEITLVARQMRGPVTGVLSRLTSLQSSGDKFAINVDGPYGTASNFLEIAGTNFDQILLVAGGVGATFILPLYRHILATNPSAQVQVVWSARTSDEMTWPVLSGQDDLLKDDRVHLFVTRNKTHTGVDTNHSSGSDDVELSQLELDKAESQNTRIPVANHRRPDIQAIVDGVFRQKPHHRVAVVVCGPVAMARDLRKAVGVWVNSGSDVWFHNESFGC